MWLLIKNKVRALWNKNEGLGTVEMVIILAVLVGLALLFRHYLIDLAQKFFEGVFGSDRVKDIHGDNFLPQINIDTGSGGGTN